MRDLIRTTISGLVVLTLCAAFPHGVEAQGTLFVEGNNVGIGTSTPLFPLQVSQANASIDVHDTSAASAARILLRLTNKGRINFNLFNEDANENWQFSNTLVGFQINQTTSPGVELRVDNNGDLFLEGNVFTSSTAAAKQGIAPVDEKAVLQRLAEMPVATWAYRNNPSVSHIGPMAEDFYSNFGFGVNEKTLSPMDTSGVALAAIKGLYSLVQEKDTEVDELRSTLEAKSLEVAELEGRLVALERALSGAEASGLN